jgi:predicted aminopeptidase
MPRPGFKVILVLGLLFILAGCETIGFYSQAVSGQLRLLSQRTAIDTALQSADIPDASKRDLAQLKKVTSFAEQQLALPVDGAYKSFVQLDRPYVVWNVFAAPAYSLQPKRWCYPVAGCASYRGYFSKANAKRYADRLREQGFDVSVSGVRAYSTLGWFDDPVLSSFLDYSPSRQAGLVFHELAHKQLYTAGDTEFNESFATAVEQIGLSLWLTQNDEQSALLKLAQDRASKARFLALVTDLRHELQVVYGNAALSDGEKQIAKESAFKRFRATIREWGEPAYQRWDSERLNNAHLVPLNSYNRWVCAFTSLYEQQGSFTALYAAAETLAALDDQAREEALLALSKEGGCEL